MICWGDHKNCGIFVPDALERKNCTCEREMCISDLPLEDRQPVTEVDLEEVQDNMYMRSEEFLKELSNIIKIKSISSDAQYDKQNKQIIDRLAQYLKEREFEVDVVEIKPKDNEGNLSMQYVLFANYFSTPIKNVVLFYGYVDVPDIEDLGKWKHDPFKLIEEDDLLFGQGLATSKGPILAWIQAIDSWLTDTTDIPVNVRLVIEVNHYQNSRGLRQLIEERQEFFQSVDLILFCTNYWIAEKVPMLISSYSGYVYFSLNVYARDTDPLSLPSSAFPSDPMSEMCLLLNTLMDPKKGSLVKDLQRHVTPLTQNDWNILCKIESGPMELKESQDIKRLPHEQSRPEFLKHRWCMPSISIHKVKTFNSDSLRTLRTPSHCMAEFSVKVVSQQSLRYVIYLIQSHFDEAYRQLKCVHTADLRVIDKMPPLNETRGNPFTETVGTAFKRVFNCKAVIPDNLSVTLPIVNVMRKYCMPHAFSVGVPFSSIHSQPGRPNESLPQEMYFQNVDLFVNIMYEISFRPPGCKCDVVEDFCFESGNDTALDFMSMIAHRQPSVAIGIHELDAWEQNQKLFTLESSGEKPDSNYIRFGNKLRRKLD
ncbi:beta-Ala-His dipeptidase-like [Drosophila tropicalis]|uniref:beta-Ala-His dipeptidase-like n=1 Tax=Drosophila tropicalis TaxID=46794 RepID=UPI0035ABE8CC